MKSENIIIANLKCGGCEHTIQTAIKAIKGVETVSINQNEDLVNITYDGDATREVFTKKLHALGYPEATEHNGLLLKLKSYKSCLVGKLSK